MERRHGRQPAQVGESRRPPFCQGSGPGHAPASPTNGDTYIVAAAATGAWAGKDGQVTMPITTSSILPRRQVPEIATGPVVAVGVDLNLNRSNYVQNNY